MSARALPVARSAGGLIAAAALLALAPSAGAHGGAAQRDGKSVRQAEAQHAGEHAIVERWAARIRTVPAAEKQALRRRALGQTSTATKGRAATQRSGTATKARRLADQAVGPADVFGAWTSGPFKAPTYGIHAILMPTGRVLLMSMGINHGAGRAGSYLGQDVNNDAAAAVWDPARGTGTDAFKFIPPPPITLDDPQKRKGHDKPRPAPVYCSGHVQLADGRVLIAGGNLEGGNGGYGLKISFLFDPFTESWIRQPDMIKARWYPTLTRLPNGKVLILAGRDETGVNRPEVELYPADGQEIPGIDSADAGPLRTSEKGARKFPSFYPHTYVMKDGKVAVVGPSPNDQGILDTDTWQWSNSYGFSQGPNGYPSSFPQPGTTDGPDRIYGTGGLSTGGHLQPLVQSMRPGIDTRWTTEPALKLSRRNSPAVLLPDGSVVSVGGGEKDLRTVDPANLWPTRRQPELWDAGTRQWRLGPAQQRPRGYHSSALLLPDGRVMSVGDDLDSVLFDDDLTDPYDTTIELYSPPYLFKGPRPQITAAEETANYGRTFRFTVAGSADAIDRVSLVAPGSNTHALDMNQRQLDLRILSRAGNLVRVAAPPNAAAAPPGGYMLFALSSAGAPSVAQFIQVLPEGAVGQPEDARAPDWGAPNSSTPTPAPTPWPTATPAPTPTPAPSNPRPWWWPLFLPWTG